MSIQYLVRFKPLEPYFFGNEKSFMYPEKAESYELRKRTVGQLSNSYFIRSEAVPSQTTILGSLRYILLDIKKPQGTYSDDELRINAAKVGEKSFCYSDKDQKGFGCIEKILPLMLMKGDAVFVPTPFDHKAYTRNEKKDKTLIKFYRPFSAYEEVDVIGGKKYYTGEYDPKDGIEHSYMNIDNGELVSYDDIFTRVLRVGRNGSMAKKAFFKKEYVSLNKYYSFGAIVELRDGTEKPQDMTVYLGQGKSLFAVSFEPCSGDPVPEKLSKLLRSDVIYCRGDSFVSNSVYDNALFAVTDTKHYRAYTTDNGRVTKHSVLYKQLCAGSIFIPQKNKQNELLECFNDTHAQIIGFNITFPEKENK